MAEPALAAKAEGLMAEQPKISEAAKNLFTALLAEGFCDTTALHAFSKTALQAISAHEMLETPQWGVAHPQGEQSGSDRMEQLGNYKVSLAVWKTAKQSGTRPTKLLGRTWLRAVWNDIEGGALAAKTAEMDAQHGEGLFSEYLTRFRSALDDDESMFWAADFDKALQAQAAQRRARAAERLAQQEEMEKHLAAEVAAGLQQPDAEPEPEPEPEDQGQG